MNFYEFLKTVNVGRDKQSFEDMYEHAVKQGIKSSFDKWFSSMLRNQQISYIDGVYYTCFELDNALAEYDYQTNKEEGNE